MSCPPMLPDKICVIIVLQQLRVIVVILWGLCLICFIENMKMFVFPCFLMELELKLKLNGQFWDTFDKFWHSNYTPAQIHNLLLYRFTTFYYTDSQAIIIQIHNKSYDCSDPQYITWRTKVQGNDAEAKKQNKDCTAWTWNTTKKLNCTCLLVRCPLRIGNPPSQSCILQSWAALFSFAH